MVTKKANNTLAFLRRNISRSPRDVKARCYESLVRPNLEYASSAWDPYTMCNWKQYKGESPVLSVETTTLQAVFHTWWAPLVESPFNTAANYPCYAVSHYQSISYHIQPYLQPSSVTTRGHRLRYMIPFCRTDILSRSYFPSTIRLWNQIPQKESTALPWTLSRQGLPPWSFEYP